MESTRKNLNASTKVFSVLGSSSHSTRERNENDLYSTPPFIVEELLKHEKFSETVWEPCCGEGCIAEALKKFGYSVKTSDLFPSDEYPCQKLDVLSIDKSDIDIVTNPPYGKDINNIVKHLLSVLVEGRKLAVFCQIRFLESKWRYENIFSKNPPKTIYVCVNRVGCAKKEHFVKDAKGNLNYPSAVCYVWLVFEKGFQGDPIIKWINC